MENKEKNNAPQIFFGFFFFVIFCCFVYDARFSDKPEIMKVVIDIGSMVAFIGFGYFTSNLKNK